MTWAQRLKRVFNIDVSICEKRGGEARVMPKAFAELTGQALACIEEQAAIDKILAHLMKKGALTPPRELLPAAWASPDSGWLV